MKSLTATLGVYERLLTTFIAALFFTGTSSATAQEIKNQASASGENLPTGIVNSNETSLVAGQAALELIKTADRAAAEPGDTVVYRLALKNNGAAAADNIKLIDKSPLGVRFLPESLQGSITTGTNTRPVTLPPAEREEREVTFTYPRLEPGETLNVIYAAVITPDAVRGDGRNTAQERGGIERDERDEGKGRSNIASFLMRIRPGILSDCGTIVGRVFVDKNFDGEQQPGEPGVPNAVIYMDDGNRITTDTDGLFSLANVIAGNRSGTLDLSSLPGYSLAPNLYFIEGNSQSRLVRLAPGGMARMNFAVTPAYGEEQ
jgi:uncharacterized repeat protein (TIGR01451 family)